MGSKYEKELAIVKLQNALLRLPKDDLIKLLKNTYQAMRIKHCIPYEKKFTCLPADEKGRHNNIIKSFTRKSSKPKTNLHRNPNSKNNENYHKTFANFSKHSKNLERVDHGTQYDPHPSPISDPFDGNNVKNREDGQDYESVDNNEISNKEEIDGEKIEPPTFRQTDMGTVSNLNESNAKIVECKKFEYKDEMTEGSRIFRISQKDTDTPKTPTFSPRVLDAEISLGTFTSQNPSNNYSVNNYVNSHEMNSREIINNYGIMSNCGNMQFAPKSYGSGYGYSIANVPMNRYRGNPIYGIVPIGHQFLRRANIQGPFQVRGRSLQRF